jgi:hypothetical protein
MDVPGVHFHCYDTMGDGHTISPVVSACMASSVCLASGTDRWGPAFYAGGVRPRINDFKQQIG